jgi:hypothetical protein
MGPESSAVIELDRQAGPQEPPAAAGLIDVRCPAGHALRVPAAEAARAAFCPQCRKAFSPGSQDREAPAATAPIVSASATPPAAPAAAPAAAASPEKDAGLPADPAHPAGPVSPRVFRKVVGASVWITSGVLHAAVLSVMALIGLKAQPPVEREVVLLSAPRKLPEEEPFDLVRKRDVFRRDHAEPKGPREDDKIAMPEVRTEPAPASERPEAAEPPPAAARPVVGDDLPAMPAEMINPKRIASPAPIGLGSSGIAGVLEAPGPFSGLGSGATKGRATAESRLEAARKGGGGEDTESAVEKALEWLARNQEADGGWKVAHNARGAGEFDARYELAVTGLATLAFLGAGYDHRSGKYKDNVGRALEWLMSREKDEGCWCARAQAQEMHSQGIATLALVEGCLAAPPGADRERLRAAAQKAVGFIEKAQYPYSAWNYRPSEAASGGAAAASAGGFVEQSVVIWNGMALKAARTAGLQVDGKAFAGIARWLDDAQGLGGQYAYSGTYANGRTAAGQPKASTPCMNAAALMMRLWTGTRPGQLETDRTADIVLGGFKPPTTGPCAGAMWQSENDLYFMHHGSIALFQFGGERWKQWNAIMKPKVLELQQPDGSWTVKTPWDTYGITEVAKTALGALALESYYRYSPLYR